MTSERFTKEAREMLGRGGVDDGQRSRRMADRPPRKERPTRSRAPLSCSSNPGSSGVNMAEFIFIVVVVSLIIWAHEQEFSDHG